MRSKAFTLIELVMVIIIIGILAVAAIPKFVDIKNKAITKSELAVMLAVKEAILNKRMQNIINGTPGPCDYWPGINPFKLLEVAPSYIELSYPPGDPPSDGVNWIIQYTGDRYFMTCPHSNGDKWAYYIEPYKRGQISKFKMGHYDTPYKDQPI